MSSAPAQPVPASPPTPRGPARPLVLTADPALLDDLLRLAAAAGVEPFVADAPAVARAAWSTAPLVVVGADLCLAAARARLPRRPGVVVAAHEVDAPGDVFERAVHLGAERVVLLPDAESWLVDSYADAADRSAPGLLVAVLGGRGGAGASTLAAALAVCSLRRGLRTMLVDADPVGSGIDLVLGGESVSGLRWSQLAGARGRVGSESLEQALPRIEELTVLSFDRGLAEPVSPEAMTTMLQAGLRGHDLVVADLPRRLDDAARVALQRSVVGLLVVPAEVRATVAAARVARLAAPHCPDLRLVVRGPAPSGLADSDVAEALAMPLAGYLRPEPGLAGDLERGDPPARRGKGPLAAFCRGFLDELLAARPVPGRAA